MQLLSFSTTWIRINADPQKYEFKIVVVSKCCVRAQMTSNPSLVVQIKEAYAKNVYKHRVRLNKMKKIQIWSVNLVTMRFIVTIPTAMMEERKQLFFSVLHQCFIKWTAKCYNILLFLTIFADWRAWKWQVLLCCGSLQSRPLPTIHCSIWTRYDP